MRKLTIKANDGQVKAEVVVVVDPVKGILTRDEEEQILLKIVEGVVRVLPEAPYSNFNVLNTKVR